MTVQTPGSETPRNDLGAADAARPRKPFVRPAVQDLGGLTTLTLLGGSL